MKIVKLKKKAFVAVLAGLFASTVMATGGNGNEPRKIIEEGGSFCKSHPVVCLIFSIKQ